MKQIVSYLTVVLAFLLAGQGKINAQVAAAAPSQVTEVQDTTKSLLWEVNGKSLSTPSYVYGTIHMIGADDFFLTDPTQAVFKTAERITFEINMEDMFNISSLFAMMGSAMMDNGTTLKDLISEEDYTLVKEFFDEKGMPLFLFEKIKPLFLSALTAEAGEEGGSMQDGSIKSYEMEFMEMAKKEEKEMAGLETVEFQMGIFDSIPYKDQAQMLVDGIKGDDTGSSEFEQMVELYKAQDIHGMQNYFEGDEGIAEFEDVLLITRNKNWIPIMEKMMAEKPTFFAVGAGHLGGPMGVLQLLREAGYTVTPRLK